jgi:hypothetical protein
MRLSILASSAAFLLVACASSKPSGPPPVEVQSTGVPGQAAAVTTHRMTATVLAVDAASRKLTLRGEDGQTETVTVPPEVRRFNEVSVGDTIQAEVQEGLLFEYQPAGSAFVAPRALVAGGRTGANQAPGAGVATAVQSTVTITGIDLGSRIVQFQDPDGNKYEVKAGSKISIEKLTVGDRLLATYTTTVIIALEKKQ